MTASVCDSRQQVLHAVFHASEMGLIVLDAEGKILLWNDWMATTSQFPSDMVQGSTIEAVFPELVGSRVCHAIQEALQHRRSSLLSQTLHKAPFPLYRTSAQSKTSERVQQMIVIKPLTLGREPLYCLLQITDVTSAAAREDLLRIQATHMQSLAEDYRQAEDDVQRYATQLEKNNLALHEARQTAETATRAKSTFLASMSHELRTPMNSIIGFTQWLLKVLTESLSARQLAALHTIDRNAKHLLGLLNEILDLSKIEAGKMHLEPSPFDLREVVRDVVTQSAPLLEDTAFDLVLDLPEAPLMLEADCTKVMQIITNLVSNAIKYTETGLLTLSAAFGSDDRLGPVVRVAVQDTGPGMSPEEQVHLFDCFTRLNSEASKRTRGTGLGLTISEQYAHMHGGRIEVQSAVGEGSTFTLVLPTTLPSTV